MRAGGAGPIAAAHVRAPAHQEEEQDPRRAAPAAVGEHAAAPRLDLLHLREERARPRGAKTVHGTGDLPHGVGRGLAERIGNLRSQGLRLRAHRPCPVPLRRCLRWGRCRWGCRLAQHSLNCYVMFHPVSSR